MQEMTLKEAMETNGGTRYYRCPYGCNVTGSYGSVYAHCLKKKCFRNNWWMDFLYRAAGFCFSAAVEAQLGKMLGQAFFPTGKHFK